MPIETRTFAVSGMTCQGCERALQRAVARVPGVQDVTASHVQRRATVTFDASQVHTADLVDAIRNAGYTPDPSPPS